MRTGNRNKPARRLFQLVVCFSQLVVCFSKRVVCFSSSSVLARRLFQLVVCFSSSSVSARRLFQLARRLFQQARPRRLFQLVVCFSSSSVSASSSSVSASSSSVYQLVVCFSKLVVCFSQPVVCLSKLVVCLSSSRVRHFGERLPFRSEFSYSNLMYGLAGHVLERLTNDTWADVLRKRLTGPLGMADTHTARAVLEEGRGNLAQGYLVDPLQGASLALDQEQLWAVTDAGVSAGGVVSTTGDMARWMRFHLKGGKTPEENRACRGLAPERRSSGRSRQMGAEVSGVRLVRKRLLQETHAPQMAITSGTFPREGRYRPDSAVDDTVPAYSMGWVTGTYRGYRRLVHGGTLASYNSLLTLFPSENIGIFTASNGVAQFQSDVHWSIHNYISDFGLGEIPWLNSSTICHQRHRRHAGSHAAFGYFNGTSDSGGSSRRSRETASGIHQTAATDTASSSDPLRKYAGVYHSPALGNFTVRLDPASSSLRFRYGMFGTGHLQPGLLQEHVMRAKTANQSFTE
ncbi:hypothetical protein Bbelb_280470 [Branchiostoma belcheri]|nr:hypothetical protein Bbelb_280470 [Branchiostoma belcheri]